MSLKIFETCEQEISSKILGLPLAFCYCFMLQNLFAVPSLQKHTFLFIFIFLFLGYFLISLVVLLSLFMCSVIAHRFISSIFICFPFLFFFLYFSFCCFTALFIFDSSNSFPLSFIFDFTIFLHCYCVENFYSSLL